MSSEPNFLRKYLNEFNPWPRIRMMGTNITQDVMAGITVAFIALPLALGFGVASGLGAITGMWGAIAGGIVGGLFGGVEQRRQRPDRPQNCPTRSGNA